MPDKTTAPESATQEPMRGRRRATCRALRALANEASQQATRLAQTLDADQLDPGELRHFYESAQNAIDDLDGASETCDVCHLMSHHAEGCSNGGES